MPNRLHVVPLPVLVLLVSAADAGPPWGSGGHEIVGLTAAAKLPQSMPAFFRDAGPQLGYLNYEPDRWRSDSLAAASEAFRYDHYVDLEVIPDSAFDVQDRFEYLALMQRNGMARPERDAGLLPFAIVELYQRIVIAWGQWRSANDLHVRQFIEQRILNDAGILGHFVADGANPHHTSVHHNGWAENWPNPRGFTTERTFHSRFESQYVHSHITVDDVLPLAVAPLQLVTDVRATILEYLHGTHGELERLYELEQEEMFGEATAGATHRRFASERLATGAVMLRDLWWSAWKQSEAM